MRLNKWTTALVLSFCVAPLSHAAWNETALDMDGLPYGMSITTVAMNNSGGFAFAAQYYDFTIWNGVNAGYVFTYDSWAKLKGNVGAINGINDQGQVVGDIFDGLAPDWTRTN